MQGMKRRTVADVRAMKARGRKLSMLYVTTPDEARAAFEAGVDVLSIEARFFTAEMREAAGSCFVQVGLPYGSAGDLATADDYLEAAFRFTGLGGDCCFGAELEVVPDRVGELISRNTSLIMFGMGAGPGADAQYLFAEDVLGHTAGHRPRHAKTYRNFAAELERLRGERVAAFREFVDDVGTRAYPAAEHTVSIDDAELEAFAAGLEREATKAGARAG